jgi:hypothetical protein
MLVPTAISKMSDATRTNRWPAGGMRQARLNHLRYGVIHHRRRQGLPPTPVFCQAGWRAAVVFLLEPGRAFARFHARLAIVAHQQQLRVGKVAADLNVHQRTRRGRAHHGSGLVVVVVSVVLALLFVAVFAVVFVALLLVFSCWPPGAQSGFSAHAGSAVHTNKALSNRARDEEGVCKRVMAGR